MGKFDNIYPRGVVIDWATSPTIITTAIPKEAQPHAVFWLNKNGILYQNLVTAIAHSGKVPNTTPNGYGTAFTPKFDSILAKDEKAFYHYRSMGKTVAYRGDEIDSYLYANYLRVKTVDVPYAFPVSTKPGEHSTIWISKSDRAYATRKLALEDDPDKALTSVNMATSGILNSLSEFLFGSTFGWLLLIIAGLLIIGMLKKPNVKKLSTITKPLPLNTNV